MQRRTSVIPGRAILAASIVTSLVSLAPAANQTWQTAGPSNVWDTVTAGNWSAGPFVNGDIAIFGGTAETVDVSGSVTAGGITFNSTGYVIADADADGSLVLGGGATITLPAAAASTVTISESITAGSFSITRAGSPSGTSTLVLSGSNSIAGTITVNGVTAGSTNLTLGSDTALSASTIVTLNSVASITAQLVLNGFNPTIGGLVLAGAGTRRVVNTHASLTSTLTFDVAAGSTYAYSGQVGNTTAATQGANRMVVVKSGDGLQELSNTTALVAGTTAAGLGYFGNTTISAGALGFATIAGSVNGPASSLLILDGGVLQSTAAGTFTRTFGSTAGVYLAANNDFQMTANGGGFSAKGGKLTVNIGGAGAPVGWGSVVGSELVGPLKFGHSTSNNETEFTNPIALNGAVRTVDVTPGTGAASFARMSGALTDGSGSGGLMKTGSGTLLLSGSNTYTGTTTVAAGVLSVQAPGSLAGIAVPGAITVNGGGTLQIRAGGAGEFTDGNVAALLANSTLDANSTLLIEVLAGNTTAISTPNAQTGPLLRKEGAGDLVLTAASAHAGGTVIAGGRVFVGDDSALGAGAVSIGAATLAAAGTTPRMLSNTLVVTGNATFGNAVNNGALTFAGGASLGGVSRNLTFLSDTTISGGISAGTITQKLGAGTLTLLGGSYAGSGVFEIREGNLVLDGIAATITDGLRIMATAALGAMVTVDLKNGASLFINNNGSNLRVGYEGATITDGINIANIAGTVFFPGASTSGSVLLGSDSALAQLNLLPGGLITARSVGIGASTPAGAITEFNFDGGTLRSFVSNAGFFNNVLTAANVKAGGGTIDSNGFAITVTQPLLHDPALGATPDGGIIIAGAGSVTFGGANTYTGNTVIAPGGTLQLGAGGTVGSVASPVIANDGTLIFNRSDTVTFGTAISGAGALIKQGTGTLVLSGSKTYTGSTTVIAGRLDVTGTLASPIVVNDGTTIGGEGFSSSTLTIGSAIGATIVADASTPAALSAAGGITLVGANTVEILNATPGAGIVILDSPAGITGALPTLGNPADFRAGSGLVFNGANTQVLLNLVTASIVWDGSVSSAWDINTSANWRNGVAPDNFFAGDAVLFDDTAAGPNFDVTIGPGVTVRPASITFNNTAGTVDYTISGSGQIGGDTALIKNGTGEVVIGTNNTFAGTTTINAGTLRIGAIFGGTSGTLGSGPVVNNASLVITRIDAHTFANAISGTGQLTHDAAGFTTLSGASSYTGPTAISAGTLGIGHAAALGTPAGPTLVADSARLYIGNPLPNGTVIAEPLIFTGGPDVALADLQIGNNRTGIVLSGDVSLLGPVVFSADGGSSMTLSGVISGTGASITLPGAGTIALSGANTFDGGVTLSAGVLQVGSNTALGTGSVTFNGGTLSSDGSTARSLANALVINAGTTLGSATNSGTLTLGGGATLGSSATLTVNSTVRLDGVVDDGAFDFALTKAGTGDLVLGNANTYSGGTVVSGGRLLIGNNTALGTGPLSIGAQTIASDSVAPRTIANPTLLTGATIFGDTVNTGSLTFTSPVDFAGTRRLLTFHSDTTWTAGLTATGVGGLGHKNGNGTFTLQGTSTQGASVIEVRDGKMVLDGSLTTGDALRVMAMASPGDSATVEITPGSSFTITLNTANLRIGHESATVTDGINIVDLHGTFTLVTGGAGGEVQMGSASAIARLNMHPGSLLVADGIEVAPAANGALANNEVNINGGTLRALESRTNFLEAMTSVNLLAGGATVDTNGFNITIAQPLQGGGGLKKTGAGTLTMTGANAFTGLTEIEGGTLHVNGSLAGAATLKTGTLSGVGGSIAGALAIGDGLGTSDAILAPGASIGTLSSGPLTLASDAVFSLEINSTTLQTDLLASSGAVDLGLGVALLNVSDLGGSVVSLGQMFTFLTGTSITGEFFNLPDGADVFVGLNHYAIDYATTSVSLVAVPEPAGATLLLGGLAMLAARRRRCA